MRNYQIKVVLDFAFDYFLTSLIVLAFACHVVSKAGTEKKISTMSIVFSNLLRKKLVSEGDAWEIQPEQRPTVENDPTKLLDFKKALALPYGEVPILTNIFVSLKSFGTNVLDGEEQQKEVLVNIYTESETYLLNSQKINFLQNIEYYLPRIIFWFKPVFAVQLAARYTVKQLTGYQNEDDVNFVINENMGIYQYLINFFEICCQVYQYGLNYKINNVSETLLLQIQAALLEVLNLTRNETIIFPTVAYDQLKALGADLRLGEENVKQPYDLFLRNGKLDICMQTAHFLCVICTQHYDTSDELTEHVTRDHTDYMCNLCGIGFVDYLSKLSHSLTFCRRAWYNTCLYCNQIMVKCVCLNNSLIAYKLSHEHNEREQKSINKQMYTTDFFSTYFEFFCKNVITQKALVGQISVDTSEIGPDLMPKFHFDLPTVICRSWNLDGQLISEIKMQTHKKLYNSWVKVDLQILSNMRYLRKFCIVKDCQNPFNVKHILMEHPTCPISRDLAADEFPVRMTNLEMFIKHSHSHELSVYNADRCNFCPHVFGLGLTSINMGHFLTHTLTHSNVDQGFTLKCDEGLKQVCEDLLFSDQPTKLYHDLTVHSQGLKEVTALVQMFVTENLNIQLGYSDDEDEVYNQTISRLRTPGTIEKKHTKNISGPQRLPFQKKLIFGLSQYSGGYDYDYEQMGWRNPRQSYKQQPDEELKVAPFIPQPAEQSRGVQEYVPPELKEAELASHRQLVGVTSVPAYPGGVIYDANLGQAGQAGRRDNLAQLGDKGKMLPQSGQTMSSGQPHQSVFVCENENHNPKLHFETFMKLQFHILTSHKCPYHHCAFYDMYDRVIMDHYKSTHLKDQKKCTMCSDVVDDLQSHLDNVHAKCLSCKHYFLSKALLKRHEPNCNVFNVKNELTNPTLTDQGATGVQCRSLRLDESKTDSDFSQTLLKLLAASNLSAAEKTIGFEVINKKTSENRLSRQRLRDDVLPEHKYSDIFFDIPRFDHSGRKENTNKAWQALGQIRDVDKFDPSSDTAGRLCVVNFECLENILKRLETIIILGNLSEQHACIMLQGYLSQKCQDSVVAYTRREFHELSYKEVIQTLQYLFCPIKIHIFERKVLGYKINAPHESFLSFASRCLRHLSLCSKKLPENEREAYVERHRASLLRMALPPTIFRVVEKKENLYKPFTSQEYIDIFLQQSHTASNTDQYEDDIYKVMNVRGQSSSSTLRSKKEKLDKPQRRTNNFQRKTQKGKNMTDDKMMPVKHRNVLNVDKQEKTSRNLIKVDPNKISEATKLKFRELAKYKVDVNYLICLKCLKTLPHDQTDRQYGRLFECPDYPSREKTEELCFVQSNGKKVAHGYHPVNQCKHRDNKMQEGPQAKSPSSHQVEVWRPSQTRR